MAGERDLPSRGDLADGFKLVGRRPRGAAPGNIVSPERADEYERSSNAMDEIWGDRYGDRREARLRRTIRDVEDAEDYLDEPS